MARRKGTLNRQAASSPCQWEANYDYVPEALSLSICREKVRLPPLNGSRLSIRIFATVSHSDAQATSRWVDSVGDAGPVHVIVDTERNLYASWGPGVSSFWHVPSPWSMLSVFELKREEGIRKKPTEAGNRWQTSGSLGVDGQGVVKWSHPSQSADHIPDFEGGLKLVEYRKGP